MKDKRQQMAILERKRGQLYQALRENLAKFAKMGIKAEVFIPQGKDNTAFLLIDENSIARFFQRRIGRYLRQIDRNITIKGKLEDDVLVLSVTTSITPRKGELDELSSKIREELAKDNIRCELFYSVEDYTKIVTLIDFNDVVSYFDRKVREVMEKSKYKVEVATYRESNVLAIRFRK